MGIWRRKEKVNIHGEKDKETKNINTDNTEDTGEGTGEVLIKPMAKSTLATIFAAIIVWCVIILGLLVLGINPINFIFGLIKPTILIPVPSLLF